MADQETGAETASFDPIRYSTAKGRYVIAATVLGSGMAFIDSTVVSIALPAIGKQFHASVADLQWLVNAYMLTLSGLILLGGALGDRYGRRRIFVIGVIAFAVASMVCGLAPNTGVLIGARAAQGVGGALLTPGSLAIIEAVFVPEDRSRAIGAWSGLGVFASAIGPFVGGYLIDAVSWRLIFYINAPIAVAVVLLAQRHVPETRNLADTGRVDLTGAAAATIGLVGLTYGLIEGPTVGWASPSDLVAIIGGAALVVSFVFVERRAKNPLVPLGIFSSRQFSAANIATFFIYGAFGGAFFLAPVELEQVLHFSPLEAGGGLLPASLLLFFLSARFGALSARYGPRLFMGFGPIIAGFGLALFWRLAPGASYGSDVLPPILVFGFGLSVTVAPLTATVMGAAPVENTGVASAVNNAVARAASLITVAVLPAAAGIGGASYLKPTLFNSGFRNAVLIAGGVCAAGGLVALIGIRDPRRSLRAAAPAAAGVVPSQATSS
jgi:EmrB/QacA subfamily drug resistance transporter